MLIGSGSARLACGCKTSGNVYQVYPFVASIKLSLYCSYVIIRAKLLSNLYHFLEGLGTFVFSTTFT